MDQSEIKKLNKRIADIEGITYLPCWPNPTPEFMGYVLGKDGSIQSWEFDGSFSRAGCWMVVETYSPVTDWAQAGSLIEKYSIAIERAGDGWAALFDDTFCNATYAKASHGETPLIAAMLAISTNCKGIMLPEYILSRDGDFHCAFNPENGYLYEMDSRGDGCWVKVADQNDVQYLSSVYAREIQLIDDVYHSDKIGRWS